MITLAPSARICPTIDAALVVCCDGDLIPALQRRGLSDAEVGLAHPSGSDWWQSDPVVKPIGKPTFDPGEYEAYKRHTQGMSKAVNLEGLTLTPVDYDPFAPSRWGFLGGIFSLNAKAFKSAMLTVLIGLGITGAACLAVFDFFRGLGWVIAGFARD